MELTPAASELLTAALRTRAGTRAELATTTGLPSGEVDRLVGELAGIGFLSETSGRITYRRPDVAAADLTRGLLSELGVELEGAITRTSRALSWLPGLLQAWEMGGTDDNRLPIDVLHGPWAPADMWQLQYSRGIPHVSDVCMPDTRALFAVRQEHQASFWQARAGEPLRVRLLMSVEDVANPASRDRVAGELAAGVEIRMHPAPPSWFWITDHDTVGLPLRWGESWPTSVMAIQSPALAEVLTWVYERVWAEAVPVVDDEHPWQSLLELMRRGMTMEGAAHALGLSPRTARRRVAAAMDHFDVSSLFALGVAWGNRPTAA